MSTPGIDLSQLKPVVDMRHEPCEPASTCPACRVMAHHLMTTHQLLCHHFPLVDGLSDAQLALMIRYARGSFTPEQWAVMGG